MDSAILPEKPQPLAYTSMLEAGSGNGNPSSTIRSSSFDFSSPVSPSLITAKCWNNYENDDDCKHLNVITAGEGSEESRLGQGPTSEPDDDSIITPVVIFESSSTLEPLNSYEQNGYNANNNNPGNQVPPSYLAPPYFSSTSRPDADNVVLARHRTPPTANDVYAAPPAGATVLPDLVANTYDNPRHRQRPVDEPATMMTQLSTTQLPFRYATRPSTSVYVATPQPGKATKTTTSGRTCRDENDEDCDEPNENDNDNGKNDAKDDEDDGDDDSNGDDNGASDTSVSGNSDGTDQLAAGPRFKSTSSAGGNKAKHKDYATGSSSIGSSSTSQPGELESGSGVGPQMGDDNEDDNDASTDDDDDSDGTNEQANGGTLEGSGAGAELPVTESTRYVEISSVAPNQGQQSNANGQVTQSAPSPTSPKPGAEIEVVVHPTLPPSFPITTTRFNHYHQTTTEEFLPTTTTIMPDDTYKSKPIFPSTTQPASGSDNQNAGSTTDSASATVGANSDGLNELDGMDNSIVTTSATTEVDLDTFKPIPMPALEGNSINGDQIGGDRRKDKSFNLEGAQGKADLEPEGVRQVADRHKFDPSAAPVKFGNSWMHSVKPQNSYNPSMNEQWPLTGMLNNSNNNNANAAASQLKPLPGGRGRLGDSRGENNSQRAQSEILSTMILYSAMFILITTAIIIAVMSFAYWRRNKLRQQAMLQKGPGGLMNGRGNQMVGSVSHGSGMVGSIQQPSLLTTYSLGQGVNMGKVITSVVKPPENIVEEEEEQSRVLNVEDDQSKDQMDGSFDGETHIGVSNGARQPVANSSWSTEDQTTSSGSQRTSESQSRPQMSNSQQHQQQQQHQGQMQMQYPERRQNSSSISDSQGSPEGSIVPAAPQHIGGPIHPPGNQASYLPDQAYLSRPPAPPPQPMPYNSNIQPNYGSNMQQQPILHPSRSVEDLRQQVPPLAGVGHVQIGPPYMGQGPSPMFKPPVNGFCPPINGAGHTYNGDYQPSPTPLVNGDRNSNGNGMIRPQMHEFQFNSPISPSRVAMNPLATMGRRYQPGIGLNRNIYSEDSSSFMTTSPSLARTSSSSSFAFNNSNQQTPTIRAKPLLDPTTGRVFNDYTPANYNNGSGSANNGPPIMGRKDRSEAWYV